METLTLIKNSYIPFRACLRSSLALVFLIAGFAFKSAQAQVSINIDLQPLWGPVNYDYVEYYYLPEVEVYYNVPTSQFIYFNAGSWVFAPVLPPSFHVDLYRTYKVVVNEREPYNNHRIYQQRYRRYKNSHGRQGAIRDSHDQKYYRVKGHPGPDRDKGRNQGGEKHDGGKHGRK